MAVRLIAGRAGSGKTHWCLSHIREALEASPADGSQLILLVPEQAALQMERALLAMLGENTPPTPGERRPWIAALGRCEVLSFRRLAHRILNETTGPTPSVITTLGRQMTLRHLILRKRRDLREFSKVAERSTFVAAIARGVTELLQESVTIEQLEAAAQEAEQNREPAAARLHDTAIIYRAYLEHLGSQRVDPEGVLDLARARLSRTSWLNGAQVWIDGFAGLTQQQMRMLVALAQRAAEVNIALLLDPPSHSSVGPLDELSIFARTERTWQMLAKALREGNVPVESPIFLGREGTPRFAQARELEELEKHLFRPALIPRSPTATVSSSSPVNSAEGCVRFIAAADRRVEVNAALKAILDLVQHPQAPLRYRDIAIVVRDLAPYHDLLSAALKACRIPFFIDRRRPTHHHPLIQLVRAVIGLRANSSMGESIALLLHSGLSHLNDEAADALENYFLAQGLVIPEVWKEEWKFRPGPENPDHPLSPWQTGQLEQINTARQAILAAFGEWWPDPEKRTGQRLCRRWVEDLFGVLRNFAVAAQLQKWSAEATQRGELDEAVEHQQVWNDLTQLLDEVVETLGHERMTGTQFREVLEAGLAEFTLGLVPATVDQVLVSSIERSRHPPVKAVFILGFQDGLFPQYVSEETILGDEERSLLLKSHVQLGRSRSEQVLDERMLAYIAVTRPSQRLWVSYPESDEDGRQTSPSPYWNLLRGVLPKVPVEQCEAPGWEGMISPGNLAGGLAMGIRNNLEALGGLPAAESSGKPLDSRWLTLYEQLRTVPLSEALRDRPIVSSSPEDRRAFPPLAHAAAMARWALSSLATPRKAILSQSAMNQLWRKPYRTSVTRLEQYAWCPFQHFAASGLKLEPRELHDLSVAEMGVIYHTILEQFVNELLETGQTLRDLSEQDIATKLARLGQTAISTYAEQTRLEEREQRKAYWRSSQELLPAMRGQQRGISETKLRPKKAELSFGPGSQYELPSLELSTPANHLVWVRGKIDRVDLLTTEQASLAVVFDYKRSIDRKLTLHEAYHGLALQLLTYLLVIREHGDKLTGGAKLIPGGAFFLPLISRLQPVEHPDDTTKENFNAFKGYHPRGILDFDWIDSLEPGLSSGHSSFFNVYRTKEGKLGYADRSDAMEQGTLPLLLDYVRRKMGELADEWLSGNIAVAPARLGKDLPCSDCLYRSVCRYEYTFRDSRNLPTLSRQQVLEKLAAGDHANSSG